MPNSNGSHTSHEKNESAFGNLTELKGVGDKLTQTLAKLDIFNIQDLIFHFPFRYENRTFVTPIKRLKLKQPAVVDADIINSKLIYGKRRSLSISVQDDSGICHIRLFHFNASQTKQLKKDARIRIIGEPSVGSQGLEFYHPEYKIFQGEAPALEDTLTPIYSICEGISSKRLTQLIRQALKIITLKTIPDLLPEKYQKQFSPLSLEKTIQKIHQPDKTLSQEEADLLLTGAHPLQQKLAFEELIAHSLSSHKRKSQTARYIAPTLHNDQEITQKFLESLPFQLTQAQQKVIKEINQDISKSIPMRRLIQGDVGSGKTIVAANAALCALSNGVQVALMAPTEILAEQHLNSFEQWFDHLGIRCGILLGKMKAKEKREVLLALQNNEIQMIIGTHALFQKDVTFYNLGLVIIDEQHRFGVHQRLTLNQKGNSSLIHENNDTLTCPHQIIMTATPIPRSLAMTVYGDLECSIIDELPPGRKPITTVLIDNQRHSEIASRINEACQTGKQAYWVCTLIEESESLQAKAAEVLFDNLRETLPKLKIGIIHGRLKPNEKADVIEQFRQAKLDLLVATTVIEVGVDIPNASLMIIENAERLGLAQLHQLRGRVGRGSEASFCALLYESPLGYIAKQRLSIMRDSNDGFEIAEKDLAQRGPGEVLGTRQAGAALFKVADLLRDGQMLSLAKNAAGEIHKQDLAENKQTSEQLIQRWLGEKQHYHEA